MCSSIFGEVDEVDVGEGCCCPSLSFVYCLTPIPMSQKVSSLKGLLAASEISDPASEWVLVRILDARFGC